MDWKLEDHTDGKAGFLRILCDGERAADVFPYAKDADPAKVTERAVYMVSTLNGFKPDADDAITCEGCGKEIKPGDKYTTTLDGCYLCEEDAPSFQDCADHWAGRDPTTFDEEEQETAEGCRKALADHIAAGGSPDDKPLTVME